MPFRPEHDMHKRRFSRNLGVGLTLAAFVALVFALTVVKVMRGEPMANAGVSADMGAATETTEGADQ